MDVHVAHAIPGRIRLKVPDISASPDVVAEVQHRLASWEVLRDVEMNLDSSSVVVYYDVESTDGVLDKLESLFGGFSSHGVAPRRTLKGAAIADLFQKVDKQVEQRTGVGLRLLVPVLLLACAVLALMGAALRGRKLPLPSWYDLLWFAFNTFIILNLPHASYGEGEAGAGGESVGGERD